MPRRRPYIKSRKPVELYWLAVYRGRLCDKNEETILADPTYACSYAANILKKRWYKAEGSISKSPAALLSYSKLLFDGKKLPLELHAAMICHYMTNKNDIFCNEYFKNIDRKTI